MPCKVSCNGAVSHPSILECYANVDECDLNRRLTESLCNISHSDLVKVALMLNFHVYCINNRHQG